MPPIGKTLSPLNPFKLLESIARGVTSATISALKLVTNTGFEAIKFGSQMVQMMGPAMFLMNPFLAMAAPMLGQMAGSAQGWTNNTLTNFNNQVQGREVPQPNASPTYQPTTNQYASTANPYGQQPMFYPPAFDQRYAMQGGFGGQYANQMMYAQMAQSYPQQMPPGPFQPYSAPINPAAVYGSQAATASQATAQAGFMPTGNETYDLANAIANAPTYSPTEMALLSKIKDPEQRAIQELQMQMQKQALLCTVLTNLANMRHEMLKAVAQNLRS